MTVFWFRKVSCELTFVAAYRLYIDKYSCTRIKRLFHWKISRDGQGVVCKVEKWTICLTLSNAKLFHHFWHLNVDKIKKCWEVQTKILLPVALGNLTSLLHFHRDILYEKLTFLLFAIKFLVGWRRSTCRQGWL